MITSFKVFLGYAIILYILAIFGSFVTGYSLFTRCVMFLIFPLYLYNRFDNQHQIKKICSWLINYGVIISGIALLSRLLYPSIVSAEIYVKLVRIITYLYSVPYVVIVVLLIYLFVQYYQNGLQKAATVTFIGASIIVVTYFTRVFTTLSSNLLSTHHGNNLLLFGMAGLSVIVQALFVFFVVWGLLLGEEGQFE